MTPDRVAAGIAMAALAGEWEPEQIAARARDALALRADRRPPAWLLATARTLRSQWPVRPADAPRELAAFVACVPAFTAEVARRREAGRPALRLRRWAISPVEMAAADHPLPALDTVADLAGWLGVEVARLDWYADCRSLDRTATEEALRHYRYRVLPKRSGGARLLEIPKPTLAALQRRLLHEVLDLVPGHDAAHGFRAGRSVVTFAAPHTGAAWLLRVDLEGFFAAVSASRVYGLWRSFGYAEPVAHTLTGLVTTAAPAWARRGLAVPVGQPRSATQARQVAALGHPHLPQGAPTSPAVANLVARQLDTRLAGLAAAWSLRYTRYADDLAFSGQAARSPRLREAVTAIVRDEGWRVAAHKTQVRGSHERQQLTGLVVNERTRPPRSERDRLRAALHDARTRGPLAGNRHGVPDLASHLRGRIAWLRASDPVTAQRYAALYDSIDWGSATG